MNRPIIRTHNAETNEIIDREMNDDEYAQWEKDKVAGETRVKAQVQAAAAKMALLEKLGITEEEAKLLLS